MVIFSACRGFQWGGQVGQQEIDLQFCCSMVYYRLVTCFTGTSVWFSGNFHKLRRNCVLRMDWYGWHYLQIKRWRSSWQIMALMYGLPMDVELYIAYDINLSVLIIQLYSSFKCCFAFSWLFCLSLNILVLLLGFLGLVLGWNGSLWPYCHVPVCVQQNWTETALCCAFTGELDT